jgi:hypothetical protein
LAFVNSFFDHKKRGTWFNRMLGRWYELDGFIMRKEERHRYAKKLCTIGEYTLSDHKPKRITIEIKKWHWKTDNRKKVPKIRWERLKDPEIVAQYRLRIREIFEERGDIEEEEGEEETSNYREIIEVVTQAATEVCGIQERRIENPWMIGREEDLQRMKSRISGAVTARNDLGERERTQGQNLEVEIGQVRERLKEARREMKRETRRWEREWWEEIINQCAEAEGRGDSGKMYRVLKDLGRRGWKGKADTTTITKEEFRDHFKAVSERKQSRGNRRGSKRG